MRSPIEYTLTKKTKRVNAMTTTAARHVEIDSTHAAAICREIAQRLDRYFKKDAPAASPSPQLEQLLARLRQLEEQR
jgi:hypothetical protein